MDNSKRIIPEDLVDGHNNEARKLGAIFNGDLDGFVAHTSIISETEDDSSQFKIVSNTFRELFCLLEGEGSIVYFFENADKRKIVLDKDKRLLIPADVKYKLELKQNSKLLSCREDVIESVPSGEIIIFNDFAAKQIKLARMKMQTVLGGHYHDYDELFYLVEGKAVFALQDVASGEIKEILAKQRDKIFVPKGTAHKVLLSQEAVLIGCTEECYVSPEKNDRPYNMDHITLEFKN